MISRRQFVKASTAISGAVLGFPAIGSSAEALAARPGQRPRHIIHMVADGMASGTFACGELFAQTLRRRGLTWTGLYGRPGAHFGLMNMRSLNSFVTDSSAASSSWGSGSRIKNGSVNLLPDGTALKPLYSLFAEQGWKRGLVTTTEITHATPAGFAANVDKRDTGSAIAIQYLEREVDVLLGGGQKFFGPATRKDKRDLYAEYSRAGYTVMQQAGELARAGLSQRWLGTFAMSHLPFSLDRLADPALQQRVPTLASMTRRALDWLQRHDHFILQVEGGRVDHGAHNNDAAAALHDLVAFDEAIEVVLAFQQRVPDTLVVITTDHGTGGLALNGMGTHYDDSVKLFKNLLQVKCSFPEILRQLRKKTPEKIASEEAAITEAKDDDVKDTDATDTRGAKSKTGNPPSAVAKSTSTPKTEVKDYVPTPREIAGVVAAATGFKISDHRAGLLIPYLAKKSDPLFKAMSSDVAGLGQLLGNHLGIGWTSTAHTGDFVPILALGPGAERFGGFLQNVDVFRHYTQLAGINFENPKGQEVVQADPAGGAEENINEYRESWYS